MKVQAADPPPKSNPGSKDIGLNSRDLAAAKSILDRFKSFVNESVTPGMLSVMNVFEEKEGEKASEYLDMSTQG
jgi:hypothetical protein